MDVISLLDQGYAWTAQRVTAVRPGRLDAPTPCDTWSLGELLDHTMGSLTHLTEAAAGSPAPAKPETFGVLAAWAMTVWRAPGVLERTCVIPLGPAPAPVVARLSLLEVVLHGWDIAQATGEAAPIPAELAGPILEFAREAVDGRRGGFFGPDLEFGDTPSDRLVAFLGRKP